MLKRSFVLILFSTLVCASVSGQEFGGTTDDRAASGAQPASGYRVGGVVSSASGRMALVNGKVSREGDWVDGAEILSIDARSVLLRSDSGELTVYLGSSAIADQAFVPTLRASQERNPQQSPSESNISVGSVLSRASPTPALHTLGRHGPVKPGETLSGIAQQYLSDGATMNQMMMAMFRANPQAFSGNINRLHTGAVLSIPNRDDLRDQTLETATAEVARQQIEWLDSGEEQYARQTDVPGQEAYGPVSSGETLSGIAQHYLSDGVTMNQMMMAMFRANPEAFSGNINRLHTGAVLSIPNRDDLSDQTPDTATAEVMRQTDVWRAGSRQQARLVTTPAPDIAAPSGSLSTS